MSKYFNQTLRARNGTLSIEEFKNAETQENQGTPEPVAKANTDSGLVRLESCRKLSLPVTGVLRAQFQGTDTLGSVEEAYRALRTRLLRLRASTNIRSITLTSAAQAEGKTMTSLNLALCCAQLQDLKVLLVDADLRTQGLTRVLHRPSGPGLGEFLSGQCEAGEAIVGTDVENLYFIGAGTSQTSPAELLASQRWPELIAACNGSFKLILVDSPPVLDLSDAELIMAACDGVLMVVRSQQTRREVLEKAASRIDAKKLLGSVYNAAARTHHSYNYTGAGEK